MEIAGITALFLQIVMRVTSFPRIRDKRTRRFAATVCSKLYELSHLRNKKWRNNLYRSTLPKQQRRDAVMRKQEKSPGQDPGQKEARGSFGRPGHEQLVKGLSHPVRTECLTVLSDRVASPREISEALDQDLSNVSYHVRVLDELGLIELVHEEPVRGAVAHYYKAVERPLLSNEEWEEMPLQVRQAISSYGWDVLIKDASEAIEKGTFDNRADRHLTRTPLLLDSKGFARLSNLMDELLETIFEEQAASAGRRKESGEEPIHAVAATALFSMPDPEGTSR